MALCLLGIVIDEIKTGGIFSDVPMSWKLLQQGCNLRILSQIQPSNTLQGLIGIVATTISHHVMSPSAPNAGTRAT